MDIHQLKAIAKRGGIVKWIASGMYEKLGMLGKRVTAQGPNSPIHFLSGDRTKFHCVEVNPKSTVPAGELLFPRGPVPYGLIVSSHYKYKETVRFKAEARERKKNMKIVAEVMES